MDKQAERKKGHSREAGRKASDEEVGRQSDMEVSRRQEDKQGAHTNMREKVTQSDG